MRTSMGLADEEAAVNPNKDFLVHAGLKKCVEMRQTIVFLFSRSIYCKCPKFACYMNLCSLVMSLYLSNKIFSMQIPYA